VTGFCNQRCDYCYNAWRGDETPTSDASSQLQRLDRLLEAFDIDHVTLTGGEPLSHKHIFAFFDRLHARGVGIQMISNGTLVTDAIAARLSQYRVRFVQITLNGPNEQLHEAHVGRGHFAPTLEGIARLRAHGVPVVGCVVVTTKTPRLYMTSWRSGEAWESSM
jgi:MoaA/NifB/PqqE/SkfB family radical SAM enzyme